DLYFNSQKLTCGLNGKFPHTIRIDETNCNMPLKHICALFIKEQSEEEKKLNPNSRPDGPYIKRETIYDNNKYFSRTAECLFPSASVCVGFKKRESIDPMDFNSIFSNNSADEELETFELVKGKGDNVAEFSMSQ